MAAKQVRRQRGRVLRLAPGAAIGLVLALSAGCQSGSAARPDPTPARSQPLEPARSGALPAARPAVTDPRVLLAVRSYDAYLRAQAAALPSRTRPFTDAVRAGDITRARSLYPASRAGWERIQWIAVLLPQLDHRIDARADDFADPAPTSWTGWHRLERILWVGHGTAGAAPVANRLDADLADLRNAVARLRITPAVMAAGITRLVEEAIAEKLPGAEDRYARTDLADLAGNIDGARAAYSFARPVLEARDAALTRVLDGRFASVDRSIARYRDRAGYRRYPSLSSADRALLQSQLGALAETVADMSAVFVR